MSYFPKPSLNENDLAIIERGDTAAHSIEAGQYVSWKGRTGRAKAAILQGADLDDTLFDYDEDGAINVLNATLSIYSKSIHKTVTTGSSAYTLGSASVYYVDVNIQNDLPSDAKIIGWSQNASAGGNSLCRALIEKSGTYSFFLWGAKSTSYNFNITVIYTL